MAEEQTNQAAEDAQADGYYGDDDMSSEELDLSFLDDEDEEPKEK